jgi:hypothetical protein
MLLKHQHEPEEVAADILRRREVENDVAACGGRLTEALAHGGQIACELSGEADDRRSLLSRHHGARRRCGARAPSPERQLREKPRRDGPAEPDPVGGIPLPQGGLRADAPQPFETVPPHPRRRARNRAGGEVDHRPERREDGRFPWLLWPRILRRPHPARTNMPRATWPASARAKYATWLSNSSRGERPTYTKNAAIDSRSEG